MVSWQWRTFQQLSGQEVYDILALREKVFILEQKSFYVDLDYFDQQALHLLGKKDDKLAGYLRLFLPNSRFPDACSLGRVVTAPEFRGQNIGKELISQALLYLQQHNHTSPVIISAQLYLQKFYESFGFRTISEPYDEDGILHIKMVRDDKTQTQL